MDLGNFSHIIGTLCMYLSLLFVLVLLPYTIVHTLLLCFGKGGIRSNMLTFSTLFGILVLLGLTVIGLFVNLLDRPLDKILNRDLAFTVFMLICWLPALCFPTIASTGHRSKQKPLFLIPAAAFALLTYNAGDYHYSAPRLMLIIPLLLALFFAAVWYYADKNQFIGFLLAVHCLLTILLLPICSAAVGVMIYDGILPDNAGLYLFASVFKRLFSGGFELVYRYLMAGEIPLVAYAVLAQFAVAGIHSTRLPKEKAALPGTPTSCPSCGNKLPANSKFCNNCGKNIK